jgi:hypothetical protein
VSAASGRGSSASRQHKGEQRYEGDLCDPRHVTSTPEGADPLP